jgi:hypothetical protein
MLIVDIVLASFQNKWIGAISGLTGLLIVVTVCTFLFVLLFLGMSFAPGSMQNTVDRIERLFEQPRLALVMNGTGLLVWTIMSITQTASALSSKACKDPSADPHAKSSKGNNDDFVKQLPSFCHTKKAGAAFCWLIFCELQSVLDGIYMLIHASSLLVTCLATTGLFLRYWKLSRKNGPRIPPFVHPADEGDFQPITEDVDGDERDDYGQQDGRYNAQMSQHGYGVQYAQPQLQGYSNENARYDPEAAAGYTRTDPFADSSNIPRQSYDYGAYRATPIPDPYSAIQTQLRSGGPPQLPPLYRGS